jgi:hypothetical protein
MPKEARSGCVSRPFFLAGRTPAVLATHRPPTSARHVRYNRTIPKPAADPQARGWGGGGGGGRPGRERAAETPDCVSPMDPMSKWTKF